MHQPNPQLRYDVFLTVEVGSAARLLLESLAILESDKPGTRGADAVADPLFAILAMGMEKLTKLTLGLNGLNTGAGWPSIAIMKGYRHNIGDLDRDACALIQAFARVQANGWVQQELDVLTADANIAEIIKTISVYAQEGRFHNLDYLSDRVVKNNSPTELWRDLEGKIIVPPIRAGLVSANDAAAFFNAAVAKSIRAWVMGIQLQDGVAAGSIRCGRAITGDRTLSCHRSCRLRSARKDLATRNRLRSAARQSASGQVVGLRKTARHGRDRSARLG